VTFRSFGTSPRVGARELSKRFTARHNGWSAPWNARIYVAIRSVFSTVSLRLFPAGAPIVQPIARAIRGLFVTFFVAVFLEL
jgi:hypothetical protein